jgi:hypothetical protein
VPRRHARRRGRAEAKPSHLGVAAIGRRPPWSVPADPTGRARWAEGRQREGRFRDRKWRRAQVPAAVAARQDHGPYPVDGGADRIVGPAQGMGQDDPARVRKDPGRFVHLNLRLLAGEADDSASPPSPSSRSVWPRRPVCPPRPRRAPPDPRERRFSRPRPHLPPVRPFCGCRRTPKPRLLSTPAVQPASTWPCSAAWQTCRRLGICRS